VHHDGLLADEDDAIEKAYGVLSEKRLKSGVA
jgi:hypothetical protein